MARDNDIRMTYDDMLDWFQSEVSRFWRQTIEDFSLDEGYVFCDECEYWVSWDRQGECPSCRMISEEME